MLAVSLDGADPELLLKRHYLAGYDQRVWHLIAAFRAVYLDVLGIGFIAFRADILQLLIKLGVATATIAVISEGDEEGGQAENKEEYESHVSQDMRTALYGRDALSDRCGRVAHRVQLEELAAVVAAEIVGDRLELE